MLFFFATLSQVMLFGTCMNPNPQPCMICGGAVARIWSMHSHEGDRYLRIVPPEVVPTTATPNVTTATTVATTVANTAENSSSALRVDFAGEIDNHFLTALVKFKDVSTGFPDFETRIQFTFFYNNVVYHLQAVSENAELRAIPETEAANLTDFSNVFAPERLKFEHSLFYVFESVKYRHYYLGNKGSAESKLVNTHSEPYRDSETLFKIIDPGQAVAGASFGGTQSSKRRRRRTNASREKTTNNKDRMALKKRKMSDEQIDYMFTSRSFDKKDTRSEPAPSDKSSIRASVKIPYLDIFTLCFWIKTKDNAGQILALKYSKSKKAQLDVSINRGYLVLNINGRNRRMRKCGEISDGKWHHICVSLQNTSRLFVYRDGVGVQQTSFPTKGLKRKKQSARVYLGRFDESNKKLSLRGDLTQVNIWDSYPLFRIQRIATNTACGGGNVVQWSDFLKNTATKDVRLYDCDDCPQRKGYDFDKKTQNNLV